MANCPVVPWHRLSLVIGTYGEHFGVLCLEGCDEADILDAIGVAA